MMELNYYLDCNCNLAVTPALTTQEPLILVVLQPIENDTRVILQHRSLIPRSSVN